ncbi:hypothetical protein B0H12DRAFT_1241271 [Mycena haematopus]|nr:hypothetical protein B0H12DRAFT_1241271 [Mycena haematopus]
MSSAFKCSPPFHPDPGVTQPLLRASTCIEPTCWRQARNLRSSAQRVSENISRGGATKYSTWEACLPAGMRAVMLASTPPLLAYPSHPVPQQPPSPGIGIDTAAPTDSIKVPLPSHPCTCVLSRSPPPLAPVSSPGPRPTLSLFSLPALLLQ